MKYLFATALTAVVLFAGPVRADTAEDNRRLNIWGNITSSEQLRRYEQQQRRLEAERQAQADEAARQKAVEAAKPENQIFQGYIIYAYVKKCNEVRQGYAVQ